MKRTLISLAAATLIAGAASAFAEEQKAPPPAVVAQLDLVNQLVALGDARKDPLLLLAAASLQKNLNTDDVALPAESAGPEALITRAKTLAAGDKDVIALADRLGASKSKDASWSIDAVTGQAVYRY